MSPNLNLGIDEYRRMVEQGVSNHLNHRIGDHLSRQESCTTPLDLGELFVAE